MSRKIYLIVAFALTTTFAFAQTGSLKGVITDAMTGINFLNAKGKSIVSVDFKDNPKLNGYHEDVMFDQPKYETLLRKHVIIIFRNKLTRKNHRILELIH